MSFFSQLACAVANNLLNPSQRGSESDPLKVVEVTSSAYSSRSVCQREQCLLVYGQGNNIEGFELVMVVLVTGHRDKLYSLCRSPDYSFVTQYFNISKDKIPYLYKKYIEMFSPSRFQELWTLIINNPQWSIAHIISYFGMNEALKDPLIAGLLTVADESTGLTPLHVAVKQGKADFLKAVVALSMNFPYSCIDAKGNSLYHYASQTSKEIIEVLSFCQMNETINLRNKDGQTPLHLACLANKPECVKALIAAGADINLSGSEGDSVVHTAVATSSACAREIFTAFPNQLHAKDMKNGGTPLHWATTKEVVAALLELGCLIDARNFNGETALHVMVQRDRFECVVTLLSHGADPNLVDNSGKSPLHVAATLGSLLLVQSLVTFGANVNLLNDHGESARHIATSTKRSQTAIIINALHQVGSKRCSTKMANCGDGCSPSGKEDGQSAANSGEVSIKRQRHFFDSMLESVCQHSATVNQTKQKTHSKGRVLCLDGGGIRGLILIQMLETLEAYLGGSIIDHFDWISGTSTGGILSLALASGKSVKECKSLYFRFKDQVFVGKRPYDAESLEGFLRHEFGNRTMADLSGPKVLVTAVVADTVPADLHLFRNYPPPQAMLNIPQAGSPKKAQHQLLWQAARASGAAPTYFRAFENFLDGGLIANNPTLDVLTEIQEYSAVMNALGLHENVQKPTVVVSLGTGLKPIEQVLTWSFHS